MFGVGRALWGSPSPTPCPSRVTQSRLHSTASRQGWNISREGDSTASLGSLGQGSVNASRPGNTRVLVGMDQSCQELISRLQAGMVITQLQQNAEDMGTPATWLEASGDETRGAAVPGSLPRWEMSNSCSCCRFRLEVVLVSAGIELIFLPVAAVFWI